MDNYFNQNACFEAEKIDLQIEKVVLNEAKDEAIIHFKLTGKSPVKIRLFNITGQLMKQQQLTNINTGYHQLQLQLEGLNTGIYYINFNTKNAILSETVVVH